MSKEDVFTQIQTLLTQAGEEATAIKQEMVTQFDLATAAHLEENGGDVATADHQATAQLTDAISKLKVSQSTKIPKYVKTDSFSRYCEKFQEYVLISKLESPNLYMYFLQNVDDETYSQLRDVTLTQQEKADAALFCTSFKKAIYGDTSISLKNEVMECRQKADEDIAKYAYRLREKAIVAYDSQATADENCFIAFLRGVKDQHMRRKLNENTSLTTFKAAVKMAKRLEKVNEMIGEDTEVNSILKENVQFSFRPKRDTSQSPNSHEQVRSRSPYRSNSSYSYPRRERSRSRDRYDYGHNRDRRNSYDRYRRRSSSRESRSRSRSKSLNEYQDRYRSRTRSNPRYGSRDYGSRNRSRTPDPRVKYRNNDRYGNQSRYGNNSSNTDRYGNRGRYGDNSSNVLTCWKCNKPGHLARNCWLNNVKHFVGQRPPESYHMEYEHPRMYSSTANHGSQKLSPKSGTPDQGIDNYGSVTTDQIGPKDTNPLN